MLHSPYTTRTRTIQWFAVSPFIYCCFHEPKHYIYPDKMLHSPYTTRTRTIQWFAVSPFICCCVPEPKHYIYPDEMLHSPWAERLHFSLTKWYIHLMLPALELYSGLLCPPLYTAVSPSWNITFTLTKWYVHPEPKHYIYPDKMIHSPYTTRTRTIQWFAMSPFIYCRVPEPKDYIYPDEIIH